MIGGVPITLLDTAGMRESVDLVEQIGVERSMAAARQADIVLMVVDAEAGWTPGDADIASQVFGGGRAGGSVEDGVSSGEEASGNGSSGSSERGQRGAAPALLVLNKTDLAAQQEQEQNGSGSSRDTEGAAAAGVPQQLAARFAEVVQTSAATMAGIEELRQAVLRLAGAPEVCGALALSVLALHVPVLVPCCSWMYQKDCPLPACWPGSTATHPRLQMPPPATLPCRSWRRAA